FADFVRLEEPDVALALARQIPKDEPIDRVLALVRIVDAARETQADVDCRAILEEAAGLTSAITFPPIRIGVKGMVADRFVLIGDVDRALAPDLLDEAPGDVRAAIAAALSQSGQPVQALHVLHDGASQAEPKDAAGLIASLAKAGEIELANNFL